MDETKIIRSMARTLYVTTVAAAYEEAMGYDEPFEFKDDDCAATMGADWFDTITSETPIEAVIKATRIVALFEDMNGDDRWARVVTFAEEWARLERYRGEANEESFGHALAMAALGTGVGLWDDIKGSHPDWGTPYAECDISEFDYEG